MDAALSFHPADWVIIIAYLLFALAVGFYVRERAQSDRESYFLAGRSLPWWWAGASIAATTFAADTPLAVAGIIADRGLSGNWLWLAWMGIHAAAVVIFAQLWNRAGVVTDAEFISLRYSGRSGEYLRLFRAGIFGVVYNCIILGWVLRAMVKISEPFFHWEEWFPGFMSLFMLIWPADSPLGSPSEGVTILLLLVLVGTYSTLGGIRGVIFTDLVQLAVALLGGFWLAYRAWSVIGGREGLVTGMVELYGADHQFFNVFPALTGGWLEAAGIGAFGFGLYLLVQSYANMPADSGGYLMQRLNASRSPGDARKASMLFVVIQYIVRVWPWFIVGLAALVLIPVGAEDGTLGGAGAIVGRDRELAYPVLMGYLLGPGILGLLVTSLMAAFMSTVDTHINWGASYIVSDVYLKIRPQATARRQIRVARISVASFVVLAVLVSFQIDTIEQAWRWVASLGAALGVPTALRWLWWRVNASAEIGAGALGLATALVLVLFTDVPYEISLVVTSAASIAGMLAGMFLGPRTDPARLQNFQARVQPSGIWPGRPLIRGIGQILRDASRILAVVGGITAILVGIQQGLIFGEYLYTAALCTAGVLAMWWGAGLRVREEVAA